jgi:hypothetical protein
MHVVVSNCAGIDVHKKFVIVAHRCTTPEGHTHSTVRRFSTMTPDLHALAAWLESLG